MWRGRTLWCPRPVLYDPRLPAPRWTIISAEACIAALEAQVKDYEGGFQLLAVQHAGAPPYDWQWEAMTAWQGGAAPRSSVLPSAE